MTLRTITYDDAEWQVVPKKLTDDMGPAEGCFDEQELWDAALFHAPEPPAQQPTRDLLAEATEQVEALDRENHRMRRCVATLMARLTVWLDDDQFNEADGIMTPEFEPPAQQPMTDAAADVLAERGRQVAVEGWTPEHDDEHAGRELARAALSYADHCIGRSWLIEHFPDGAQRYSNDPVPDEWPWDESWWKPSTPRRDLVKAAALILAEIERLDRTGIGKGESNAE